MNTYDSIQAHQIEADDQISYDGDNIEVVEVRDNGETIEVVGYSHVEGDTVTVHLNYDDEVELWTA